MNRLPMTLGLIMLVTGMVWAQDDSAEPDAADAEQEQTEQEQTEQEQTEQEQTEPEEQNAGSGEDEADLDDQSYVDTEDNDFRPSEDIPADQSIPFPTDI